MTTVITGRDLSLTIDGDVFDDAASSCTLELVLDRQEYDVLSGTVYKTIKTTGTLTVDLYQDWNAAGSLCEALFGAAKTNPDTPLVASMVANTGATFSFSVLPTYPTAGGTAPDALTSSITFTIVDGDVDLA